MIFSGPLEAPTLFRAGAFLIGVGGGLFSVGMLIAAMEIPEQDLTGMVLGAWGAVQATAAGLSMALGGIVRDVVASSFRSAGQRCSAQTRVLVPDAAAALSRLESQLQGAS